MTSGTIVSLGRFFSGYCGDGISVGSSTRFGGDSTSSPGGMTRDDRSGVSFGSSSNGPSRGCRFIGGTVSPIISASSDLSAGSGGSIDYR